MPAPRAPAAPAILDHLSALAEGVRKQIAGTANFGLYSRMGLSDFSPSFITENYPKVNMRPGMGSDFMS